MAGKRMIDICGLLIGLALLAYLLAAVLRPEKFS